MEILASNLGHRLDKILNQVGPRELAYIASTSKANLEYVQQYMKRVRTNWNGREPFGWEIREIDQQRILRAVSAAHTFKCVAEGKSQVMGTQKYMVLVKSPLYGENDGDLLVEIRHLYMRGGVVDIYGYVIGGSGSVKMYNPKIQRNKRMKMGTTLVPYPMNIKLNGGDEDGCLTSTLIRHVPYRMLSDVEDTKK